ncbi:hypothetical protein H3C65_00700 [Patescibacteria group bacterium]|nr:hypothetical protein [Patescibacteria group bacterium]
MEKLKRFFQYFLIPSENNNYQPKSLHTDFLLIYLLIAFFMSIIFKKVNLTNVLGFATDITSEKLLQLTNREREKNNLADLTYNDELAAAAYQKAQDMFNNNYWAHFSPEGKTPWDFILKSGYRYEYAGENLAKNFLFSDGVISAWMNSPSHRENILKPEYTNVGFAIVNGILNGEETTLVVQMFGRPLDSKTASVPPETQIQKTPKNSIATKGNDNEGVVLANKVETKKMGLPRFAFNLNLTFFMFLLIALALDFYFVIKLRVIRVGGKTPAHLIFIFFIIIGLIILSKGAII